MNILQQSKKHVVTVSTLGMLVLGGCTSMGTVTSASSRIDPKSNSKVYGEVIFNYHNNDLYMYGDFSGLKPNSEHGFHIHEVGDCNAPDASSTRGHYNPTNKVHGMPGTFIHHAGDLPSIKTDAYGRATYSAHVRGLKLAEGDLGILGRSLVVHSGRDDYVSQPEGSSGIRIGCGIINPTAPETKLLPNINFGFGLGTFF